MPRRKPTTKNTAPETREEVMRRVATAAIESVKKQVTEGELSAEEVLTVLDILSDSFAKAVTAARGVSS